jgi:hypothetical protein
VADTRKKRGSLNTLDDIDQDLVFSHCEPASVTLEDGIEWIKETYSVEIKKSALSDWLRKRRIEHSQSARFDKIREDKACATMMGKVFGTALELASGNVKMIQQAIFEELQKPIGERAEKRLGLYMDLAIKARAQEIKQQALALDKDRFQFNAARSALKAAAQLQQINQTGGDERSKIEQASLLLFGEDPEGFESAAREEAPE